MTAKRDRVKSAPLFSLAKVITSAVCYGPLRMRVIGAEHCPSEGALIVACNHRSYVDPVALGCALPRPVWYMAKQELFDIPVFGPLISTLGAYPVDRTKGDISAIKMSLAQLKVGRAVGIFPEGTRNLSGTAEAQSGVALLASLSGATVLPAYVKGGDRARQLGRLTIAFGEPIDFGRKATRDELAKWTTQIMTRIYALGESIGGN